MPERTSKPKRPRDINQLAHAMVQGAIRESPERDVPDDVQADSVQGQPEKNPHAQALGRLRGKKGGKARAEKLTPERRKEIARQAAEKRWGKSESGT